MSIVLSHDELVRCLKLEFPGTTHTKDYFVAMPIDLATSKQTGPAFIAEWNLEYDMPNEDELASYAVKYADVINSDREKNERLSMFKPISSRQLWLAARQIRIYESDVVAKINELDDNIPEEKEKKEILLIEISKPPLAGFLRDSPAMEDVREMMGIPSQEFDAIWIWAEQIK